MTNNDPILEGYTQLLRQFTEKYLGCWVTYKDKTKQQKYSSPGKIENVSMSHRNAICTVRWANGKVTVEWGEALEIKDRGKPDRVT